MKQKTLRICSIILFILLVAASACVAPPKTTGVSGSQGPASGGTETPVNADTTTPMYVTIVTPYGMTERPTAVPTVPTQPPEEWVIIYGDGRGFGYNKSAFAYNLRNPPMIINFSVFPYNVTGKKTIFRHSGSDQTEEEVSYDYFSPYSWFEITVRNKNNGQILQQAGFGNSYGKTYPQELNQTMRILNRGDLIIEYDGNQVAAVFNISVKKEGNIVNVT